MTEATKDTIEKLILDSYIAGETSLRDVATICNTDHHRVKRVLEKYKVPIVKAKRKPFSQEHRENLSKALIGKSSWIKGKKMPKEALYKNMATHIRFEVSWEWLSEYEDIEKLKFLNRSISNRDRRWEMSTNEYKAFIEKFYHCKRFNLLYTKWKGSDNKYMKPSIDHIVPKSKGGDNSLENLQFLTWFENRCKNDLSQEEWDELKQNIGDYLIDV